MARKFITFALADGRSTMTVDASRVYAIKSDDNNVIHPTPEEKKKGILPKTVAAPIVFIEMGERAKNEPTFTIKASETAKEIAQKLFEAGANEFDKFESLDGRGAFFVDPAKVYAVQGDESGCALYIETTGKGFFEMVKEHPEKVLAAIENRSE